MAAERASCATWRGDLISMGRAKGRARDARLDRAGAAVRLRGQVGLYYGDLYGPQVAGGRRES